MLYRMLRLPAQMALKTYFKKIYIENADSVPTDKPVFIASNHPTAWIEPCALACFLPNSLHFMVRGNLFGNPFYDKLMAGMHLIPIHRQSDGDPNHHKKNLETFKYCYDALAANKTMLIMPEGSTKQIKRLRPLKKGLARICFGAIDNSPGLDIHIVPIGSNFTRAESPRNELRIKVGKPIRVLDFYEKNKDLPARGMRELTVAVKEGMLETMVHIADEKDDAFAEQLFEIAQNNHRKSIFPILEKNSPKPLEIDRNIAEKINEAAENEKIAAKKVANLYFQKLENLGLRDEFVSGKNTFLKYLLLFVGFFPAITGAIFNYPIIRIADFINNTKVKQLEFKQPIWLSILIVLKPIYYLLWVIAGIFIGKAWFWIGLILMPIFGYIYLIYRELYIKIKNNQFYHNLPEKEKTAVLDLRKSVLELTMMK